MWSRFAYVAMLALAGCATITDGPAPKPTAKSIQQHEQEQFGHMAMSQPPPPQPAMESAGVGGR